MTKFNLPFRLVLLATFSIMSMLATAQNAWINEIHYDNTGTDQGEFIEVVIENASLYSLGQFKVTLVAGGAIHFNHTHIMRWANGIPGQFARCLFVKVV